MWEFAVKYPIATLPTFLTLLPITTFVLRMAYNQRAIRFLFLYLIAKLSIELVMFYQASKGYDNLYLSNILTVVSYFLIFKCFHEAFDSRTKRIAAAYMSAGFSIIFFVDVLRNGMTYTLQYSPMFEAILISTFVLMYLHGLIRNPVLQDVLSFPFFWMCAALLLYFSTCMIPFVLGFYLDRRSDDDSMDIFMYIPYILETPYLLIMAFGIYADKR